MGPSTLLLALLGAMAPALARAASTTTDSSIINLFVIDPTPAVPSQTIHASIMRVVPSLTQTEYYITCVPLQGDKYFGKPKPAPCNHIDGASVTINPTGMALHLVRTSIVLDARELPTKETAISVYDCPLFFVSYQPKQRCPHAHTITSCPQQTPHFPPLPHLTSTLPHTLPNPPPQKRNSHLRLRRVNYRKLHRRHDQQPSHANLHRQRHPDDAEHGRDRDHLERRQQHGRAQ